MNLFKNTYKNKMKALLEGLEIQHIERFMKEGNTEDYKYLGEEYVKAVKEKIIDRIGNKIRSGQV